MNQGSFRLAHDATTQCLLFPKIFPKPVGAGKSLRTPRARRGEVSALKVGKFWRYRTTTLDAWNNSRLQSGRKPRRMETSF